MMTTRSKSGTPVQGATAHTGPVEVDHGSPQQGRAPAHPAADHRHDDPHGREGRTAHDDHTGRDGHNGHHDHVAMFRRLFWIMLALAVPTTLASPMFADLVGYELPDVPGVMWVSPVLGTVMYLWYDLALFAVCDIARTSVLFSINFL